MKTKISKLICGGALTAGLFLGTGCVQHRVVYVREPVAPGGEVIVAETPPAPQIEIVGVAPGPQYIWAPGWWEWHNRWVWNSGRWLVRPHPHARWETGHWIRHGGGYAWRPGRWR